ncbi:MAG: prepilin-type N-terminal cleavage/methylation domain-containing protein [Sideroxyarcus sp.]
MNMQKGFTLIELMIVMLIIGLLSAIAFPSYKNHVMRGQISQATAALSDARIKFEQFYQDNRTYANAELAYCPQPVGEFQFFCVVSAAVDTYSITANGNTDSNLDGFSYSINQNNDKSTLISTTVPGWGTGGACWITKQGGGC